MFWVFLLHTVRPFSPLRPPWNSRTDRREFPYSSKANQPTRRWIDSWECRTWLVVTACCAAAFFAVVGAADTPLEMEVRSFDIYSLTFAFPNQLIRPKRFTTFSGLLLPRLCSPVSDCQHGLPLGHHQVPGPDCAHARARGRAGRRRPPGRFPRAQQD
jgi:hypothetical protein